MKPILTVEIRRGEECRHYALAAPIVDIGRARDNQVLLNDPLVSRYHARVEWDFATHGITITDLGSVNGTRVGKNTITPQVPHPLKDDDVVRIGGFTLQLHLPSVQANSAPSSEEETLIPDQPTPLFTPAVIPRLVVTTAQDAQEFQLEQEMIIIGRDPTSDIVIADRVVSRRHAQLWRVGDGYEIADLASANGLLFDGKRIANKLLADGDVVWIAQNVSLTYHTTAPAIPIPSVAQNPDLSKRSIRSIVLESLRHWGSLGARYLNSIRTRF